MTSYNRYKKLNIDASPIGLGYSENDSSYFCTPKGAKIIGWSGVDGIHYCFVRGFGQMVFAVSPMNTPKNYVHPLARNFTDFLRIILSCGDASILEQVYNCDNAMFDALLQDNPPTVTQQSLLNTIREKLSLTPMKQPFDYIKELQSEFDYSRIKYTEDYYEWVPPEPKIPEWKVYFEGNFWGHHHSHERAGKEVPINMEFVWNDENWHIPSFYICSKGLVVDFCLQVSANQIHSFMDKWNLSIENDGSNFTDEQRIQADAENPLAIDINLQADLNGNILSNSHGCGVSWNPCIPEGNDLAAKSVIQHYELDPAYGWTIWRAAFPWITKRKLPIKTLSMTLMQQPIAMLGPHFRVSTPGEHFEFIHPTTSVHHTLTVQEYEQQRISQEHFGNQDQEFPTNYTAMSYTLSPDLPDDAFTVTDCVQSDLPRQINTNPNEPQTKGSVCAIGVIGTSDGVTAMIIGNDGQDKLHAACSALHFEPIYDIQWRIVFHEKTREDIKVIIKQ